MITIKTIEEQLKKVDEKHKKSYIYIGRKEENDK